MTKSIILLQTFYDTFPNIRPELAKAILDLPQNSELKEFLFSVREEMQLREER